VHDIFEEETEKAEQKGEQKEKKEIALNMKKKGMHISLIAEITGLSEQEINSLK
jgi:predicted transposase/invertase (TIGR01784 family)